MINSLGGLLKILYVFQEPQFHGFISVHFEGQFALRVGKSFCSLDESMSQTVQLFENLERRPLS